MINNIIKKMKKITLLFLLFITALITNAQLPSVELGGTQFSFPATGSNKDTLATNAAMRLGTTILDTVVVNTLSSSTNATKTFINLGANSTYDETNHRLGINTLIPRDRLDINGAVGGSITFGGGNGKTISAYQDGTLDALWINSVNTRISGVLTIPSNNNGGNIWVSKSDGTNTSYTEIGNTASDQFYININGNDVFVANSAGNVGFGKIQDANSAIQTTSFATAYRQIGSAYTATTDDHTLDCTIGTFTVTLPDASTITGRHYSIINSSTGTITITANGTQKFTNVSGTPSSLTIVGLGSYNIQSTGTNWVVEGKL